MSIHNTRAARLPGGGFGNFDPAIVIARGEGSRVWDVEGNKYVDYLIGSGPMLLGHGNAEVLEVVKEQLSKGLTFFANSEPGIELAEVICGDVACAEQVRYVSSGGEADMYAIRLARAYTGREKIMKFEGGYHGMSPEALMSLAPKQLVNFPNPVPDTAGIPADVRDSVIISQYNDFELTRALIAEYAGQLAGIIVEPLQRIIPPVPGFLAMLREEATRHGIVLIFDEVVTGYRFAHGGGAEQYGVTPDLATLGKIVGGGFPLAATVGSAEIMSCFDKAIAGDKFTFQVGTLSGNPVAAVAGLKTIEILARDDNAAYSRIKANGRRVMAAIDRELSALGIPHQVVGDPALFEVVFTASEVVNYRSTLAADAELLARFNSGLRKGGILKPPAKWYSHLALTELDLEQTEAAIRAAAMAL